MSERRCCRCDCQDINLDTLIALQPLALSAEADVEDGQAVDGTMWDQPVSAEEQVITRMASLLERSVAMIDSQDSCASC